MKHHHFILWCGGLLLLWIASASAIMKQKHKRKEGFSAPSPVMYQSGEGAYVDRANPNLAYDGLRLQPQAPEPDWDLKTNAAEDDHQPLNFFASNKFSHACCPNEYRSTNGCACLTTEQRYMLKSRGGNNTMGGLQAMQEETNS
jgi:hypothetical protein